MAVVIFLLHLTVALTLTSVCLAFQDNNIGQYDCCPLVWKEMIETSTGMVVPPDAVLIGESSTGDNIYYASLPLELASDPGFVVTPGIGIKSAANNSVVTMLKANESPFLYQDGCVWTQGKCLHAFDYKVVILSNPHGCSIGWWKRLFARKMPDDSSEILFPIFHGQYFARNVSSDGKTEGGVIDWSEKSYWEASNSPSAKIVRSSQPGPEVLYINCKDSVRNIFDAQLFNLEYDKNKLLGKQEHVTLQASTVVNNNEYPQSSEVSMTAELTHSLQMSTESSIRNFSAQSQSSSFGKSSSSSWSLTLAGVTGGRSTSSEQESESSSGSSTESFAMTGQMVMETTTTSYTFKQRVAIPPKSSTTVTIQSVPVKGVVPFRSKYRFRHRTGSFIMSPERMFAALKRTGASDVDKMSVGEDYLILTYEGTLSVEMGYDTHVSVTWSPLDDSATKNATTTKYYRFS